LLQHQDVCGTVAAPVLIFSQGPVLSSQINKIPSFASAEQPPASLSEGFAQYLYFKILRRKQA